MTYCTGKRTSTRLRSEAMCTFSRWCSSEVPWYQGMFSERETTLSPWSAEIGMNVRSGTFSLDAKAVNSSRISLEALLGVVDQVHLVDRQHQVRDPQQRGEEGVPARLLQHALARVDQDDRQVGGGGAGHHVAGVLDVPGGVGDDELAPRRREVAVGDVDRDALLPLGPQAVGEQRQVGVFGAAVARGALDRLELVLEDRLGVEQQPPDQGGLAVVDASRRGETQDVHRFRSSLPACGPPWRPREARSSALVAPRSVIRVAAISSMISSTVAAPDCTAPVQVMSPTVR